MSEVKCYNKWMWKPRSSEFTQLAIKISKDYRAKRGNNLSVPQLAKKYNLSKPSIYRYLNHRNVKLKPRSRNAKGWFLPIQQ